MKCPLCNSDMMIVNLFYDRERYSAECDGCNLKLGPYDTTDEIDNILSLFEEARS